MKKLPTTLETWAKDINMKNKHLIKAGQTGFLIAILALPIIQFIVFYIGVNIGSISLAFQQFDGAKMTFAGLANFESVLKDLFITGKLGTAVKNSTIMFALGTFGGIPLGVIVSYAIYKKAPFSGIYKVLLFLPNMISSMVFVVCARILFNQGFPVIFQDPELFLLNEYSDSSFYTVLFFGFWMSFAGGMVIYLGAMANVSVDVMEYCQLENMSSIRELWSIVIPLIFPTITTYIVVAIAGFFTNQGFYFSFMGQGSKEGVMPYDNLGYVFFLKVARDDANPSLDYPYAAAGGLLFTFVLTPITFTVKTLLEKFGPSED